jgi:hypothetical protein
MSENKLGVETIMVLKKNPLSDSYRTDEWIMDMFHNYYDPCPYNPSWNKHEYKDGLDLQTWPTNGKQIFINPPYSNPKPWVIKAIEFNNKYAIPVVLLLKHDSSTEWFRLLHEAGANFMMINGRLKHNTNRSCAFPSVLVCLGEGIN